MRVYLQGPNGEEAEIPTTEPDPPDGSFTILNISAVLAGIGEEIFAPEWQVYGWLRICPNEHNYVDDNGKGA